MTGAKVNPGLLFLKRCVDVASAQLIALFFLHKTWFAPHMKLKSVHNVLCLNSTPIERRLSTAL